MHVRDGEKEIMVYPAIRKIKKEEKDLKPEYLLSHSHFLYKAAFLVLFLDSLSNGLTT